MVNPPFFILSILINSIDHNPITSNDFLEFVNGLFCLSTLHQPPVICNPSTREITSLPNIHVDRYSQCSLGYEPEEKIYKVLFVQLENTRIYSETYARNWVFTLGVDKSWKNIDNVLHFRRLKEGVCINGVIYMLNDYIWEKTVVEFDLKVHMGYQKIYMRF
ncbi:hypothetical protein P3L10_034244 [Capsicum annuum]